MASGGAAHGELNASVLVRAPYRAILRLALPTVVAMLSQSVVNEIDVIFFSRLPCPEASNGQAALLPSLIVVWLFGGSLSAISVGTQALTARRVAERNPEAAGSVLASSAFFCLTAGAVVSVLGLVLLPLFFDGMIRVPAVREIAVHYTRWRLLGVISMAMTMAIKSFFDGIGRTHVHLVAALVMNALNVLLCWVFIFGHWGAPRMGPVGAGVAAFLSTWVGLVVMLLYTLELRRTFRPFRRVNLSKQVTWQVLRLSVPAAAATMTMMLGFGLFTSIVGKLDTHDANDVRAALHEASGTCGADEAVYSAATTDIVEILKLTFTACMAFGTSTATLVGQSLGAQRPEDASKFGWASVRLGFLLFGLVGLCEGGLFTDELVGLITRSPAVHEAAMVPMRIMGAVTPVIAIAMILSEALFGAGDTKFVAIAQLVLIFGCLVPLAYVLGIVFHLALVGVWGSACVYAVLAAITMSIKFRGGGWKAIRL